MVDKLPSNEPMSAWPAKSSLIVALTLAVVAFVMVHLSVLHDARVRCWDRGLQTGSLPTTARPGRVYRESLDFRIRDIG